MPHQYVSSGNFCTASHSHLVFNSEDAKPVRITAYEAPRELIPIMDICKVQRSMLAWLLIASHAQVADVTLLLIAPDTAGEAVRLGRLHSFIAQYPCLNWLCYVALMSLVNTCWLSSRLKVTLEQFNLGIVILCHVSFLGLGSVIGIIQGTNKVAPKKQQAYKKIATQLMQKLFEEKPKCITLDEAKVLFLSDWFRPSWALTWIYCFLGLCW